MIDFFKKNSRIFILVAIVFSALLMAMCVMFTKLAILEWVALVPVAICLYKAVDNGLTKKRVYLLGLGFFGAYYLMLFHWFLFMYPMEFLGLSNFESGVVVAVAWLGLSFLQAAFSSLALVVFVSATGRGRVKEKKWLMPVLAAALWVLLEWGLTLTWAGVPWSRLALGQVDMPAIVQSSSLFGSYFVTFLIVFVNFLVAYALLYKKRAVLAVAICVFSANLALGAFLLSSYEGERKITVAAAQGNISSTDKWNDEIFIDTFEVYTNYAIQASQLGAEIVLLPESVVPYVLDGDDPLSGFLSKLSDSADVYLLVGAFSQKEGSDYNSILVFQPDGSLNETVYSKRRLVPFGEFLPLEGLIKAIVPPLAEINAFSSEFTAGRDSEIVQTETARLGCLICFDSIYEGLALDSVRDGAEIIMLSTNDSWFYDSVALEMHNNQARLRAIETGRSVVRAANTGISSVITPTGQISARIGALQNGILVEDVDINTDITLYTRIGNLFVLLCGIFSAFAVVNVRVKKK